MKQDKAQVATGEASGTTLSSTEAVRRAVEALGYRANVAEILEYVREHFGIDARDGGPRPSAAFVEAPAPAHPGHRPAAAPRPRNRSHSPE